MIKISDSFRQVFKIILFLHFFHPIESPIMIQ